MDCITEEMNKKGVNKAIIANEEEQTKLTYCGKQKNWDKGKRKKKKLQVFHEAIVVLQIA